MDLPRQAIEAALTRNWTLAVKSNQQILKDHSRDIDALNRLARAYFELGFKTKSQQMYQKVIRLDKFNSIAIKNLELLKSATISRRPHQILPPTSPPNFLEEPGKTKTIILTRLGSPKIVTRMRAGDPVTILAHEHCISICSPSSEYLGRLPDDLASRLRSFIKGGNIYHAWIKSVNSQNGKHTLKVFIREISKAVKFKNTPSFSSTEKLTYAAFTPPELIHEEKPTTLTTEEDQESFNINPEKDLDQENDFSGEKES
jgi:tetratricopeptide (TPR) repeat protein